MNPGQTTLSQENVWHPDEELAVITFKHSCDRNATIRFLLSPETIKNYGEVPFWPMPPESMEIPQSAIEILRSAKLRFNID